MAEMPRNEPELFRNLIYSIQGYSYQSPRNDSPLAQIQEEDENDEDGGSAQALKPRLKINREQYFTSEESHKMNSFKNTYMFDYSSEKDQKRRNYCDGRNKPSQR